MKKIVISIILTFIFYSPLFTPPHVYGAYLSCNQMGGNLSISPSIQINKNTFNFSGFDTTKMSPGVYDIELDRTGAANLPIHGVNLDSSGNLQFEVQGDIVETALEAGKTRTVSVKKGSQVICQSTYAIQNLAVCSFSVQPAAGCDPNNPSTKKINFEVNTNGGNLRDTYYVGIELDGPGNPRSLSTSAVDTDGDGKKDTAKAILDAYGNLALGNYRVRLKHGPNQTAICQYDFAVTDADVCKINVSPTSPGAPGYAPAEPYNPCKNLNGDVNDKTTTLGICYDCITNQNGTWTAIGCLPNNPPDLVGRIISIGAGIAGGLTFLYLLYGSALFVLSQGVPEKIQQGKDVITSAITGLIFIFISVLLLKLIGVQILGIPGWS